MMATILPIKQTLLDVLYFRLNLPKKQVFVKNTCFFIANLHYRVTAPKGGFLLSKKNYERKPSYLYHLIALGVRASLSTLHTRDGRWHAPLCHLPNHLHHAHHTLDGITHHERVRMQLDAYHSDYDELLRLYGEILDSFDKLPMGEHDGTHFSYDDGLYRASIDVLFNHTAN